MFDDNWPAPSAEEDCVIETRAPEELLTIYTVV